MPDVHALEEEGEFTAPEQILGVSKRSFSATDAQIDGLVYRLYGLTGKEINESERAT